MFLLTFDQGTTVVDNLLNSEDVHYMLGALKTLGLSVEADKAAKRAVVVGCGGKFPVEDAKEEVQLFLGNAGTAMRPLTAAVTAAGGNATYVFFPYISWNQYEYHGYMSSGLWCIHFELQLRA